MQGGRIMPRAAAHGLVAAALFAAVAGATALEQAETADGTLFLLCVPLWLAARELGPRASAAGLAVAAALLMLADDLTLLGGVNRVTMFTLAVVLGLRARRIPSVRPVALAATGASPLTPREREVLALLA